MSLLKKRKTDFINWPDLSVISRRLKDPQDLEAGDTVRVTIAEMYLLIRLGATFPTRDPLEIIYTQSVELNEALEKGA